MNIESLGNLPLPPFGGPAYSHNAAPVRPRINYAFVDAFTHLSMFQSLHSIYPSASGSHCSSTPIHYLVEIHTGIPSELNKKDIHLDLFARYNFFWCERLFPKRQPRNWRSCPEGKQNLLAHVPWRGKALVSYINLQVHDYVGGGQNHAKFFISGQCPHPPCRYVPAKRPCKNHVN